MFFFKYNSDIGDFVRYRKQAGLNSSCSLDSVQGASGDLFFAVVAHLETFASFRGAPKRVTGLLLACVVASRFLQ